MLLEGRLIISSENCTGKALTLPPSTFLSLTPRPPQSCDSVLQRKFCWQQNSYYLIDFHNSFQRHPGQAKKTWTLDMGTYSTYRIVSCGVLYK